MFNLYVHKLISFIHLFELIKILLYFSNVNFCTNYDDVHGTLFLFLSDVDTSVDQK